jgi:hypothetical protein
MNSENAGLEIVRVVNGWIIRPQSYRRDCDFFSSTGMQVARTSAELAGILLEWATRQEKAPT